MSESPHEVEVEQDATPHELLVEALGELVGPARVESLEAVAARIELVVDAEVARAALMATEAAREAVASFAGLVLRRLQDVGPPSVPALSTPELLAALRSVFGEALEQYTADVDEASA